MICNESWKNHDASLISEINNKSFGINYLKAQLQEQSVVVNELKQLLIKLKGKIQVTPCKIPNLDSRFQKLEDENVSLAFQVSSLVKEREHLKNNRVVHQDYLKITKEHIATLQELLEHARALKPLDDNLNYACRVNYTYASGSKPSNNTRNDRIH
ncbi:hypothetical protein Tco_1337871 [Tanacetum coccineum]